MQNQHVWLQKNFCAATMAAFLVNSASHGNGGVMMMWTAQMGVMSKTAVVCKAICFTLYFSY